MNAYIKIPLKDRLEDKLIPIPWTGCWLYEGQATRSTGYACITAYRENGKPYAESAHRAAYQVYVGPIPKDKIVCHTCDVRICCNPAHLFLGTHKDNARDRNARGRANTPKGEQNGHAKLTKEKAAAIHADQRTYKVIGEEYGVSQTTVCMIKKHGRWMK